MRDVRPNVKQFGWMLMYMIFGTSFWVPSVVIHAVRGYEFGAARSDIILITLVPIITAGLTLEIISRSHIGPYTRTAVALWILLGIWFFGPFCMMISASFSGGGFLSPEPWLSLASATVLFVPYTFMMSTYDATLAGLLIVTIWFFVVGAMGLTRRFRPIAISNG